MAAAVHVVSGSRSAEHRPFEDAVPKLWRNGHATPHAGDGVEHNDLVDVVLEEDAAVAAIEQSAAARVSSLEALRRNAVGTVQERGELP